MEIVNHVFTLRATESIYLPEYKGSVFHGGFGHALQAISPMWAEYFLKPSNQQGQALPPPYVLLPPLDDLSVYEAGQCFTVALTLFGQANKHYALAQSAIEFLGRQLGLGYRQGKYAIEAIKTQSAAGLVSSSLSQQPGSATQQVQLQIATRLRIKHKNRLHRHAPSFIEFMARLMGRMKTLHYAYANEEEHEPTLWEPTFNQETMGNIQADDYTHWDDWDRYSGRQKTWMKFGGLMGAITYRGAVQPFLPYLRLGEWIHIGGKTSFGLGKYRLIEDVMPCE